MVQFPTWKKILVALVALFAVFFTAPNFVDEKTIAGLPDWVPVKRINLGLDLRGGSHLLLEVDIQSVMNEYLDGLTDSVRGVLRKAGIRYHGLGVANGQLTVTISDADRRGEAQALVRGIDPQAQTVLKDDRITASLSPQALTERRNAAVQQTIEIIRRRIDETGVREPSIQRQGADRIILQLPGIDDPERVKALIGKTARLTFQMVDVQNSAEEATAGRVPPGSVLIPDVSDLGPDGKPRILLLKKRIEVSGENLVDAQASFDSRSGQPVVSFRFDTVGAKRFGQVTQKSVGLRFAIVLDGKIISAPVIREPILGGSGQISGNFTARDTNDLALLLRAGALPAPIKFLEERSVGPGLGADSIAAGEIASIVGMLAVVGFMLVAYGRFGVYADIALLLNMMMIIASLTALQATLTLPGIAGIALTMGMAVDANVLIFERIREEQRAGRTPISAIDAGYSRALTTIVDSNLTTLIAAVLLYAFGSGPVRGFAVTLAIGILTSMFSAIMVTRMMVIAWLRAKKPQTIPI
ncbi:MAG: protein translocase subunit SecD [Proteobacteria bacterium]|nr:protein translocase subunit SecD [Pseudomonadota bacterium]